MRCISLYFPYILAVIPLKAGQVILAKPKKHSGYTLTLHNEGYGPLGYLIFPGI